MLQTTIQDYVTACQAAAYSHNTLAGYAQTHKLAMAAWGDKSIADITSGMVAQLLAGLDGISAKTRLNHHTALSSLWRWAVGQGLAPVNVVRLVAPPRPDIRAILPYSRGDVEALLGAAREGKNAARDRAVILLLLDTGLRASELCGLKVKHIDLAGGRLVIMGKGRRERASRFSPITGQAVGVVMQGRKPGQPVFTTAQGLAFHRDTVRQVIERLGARAGVPGAHAHRFRHTFAIQFLRNGGSIYTLQAMLGHTSLDMCKRYLAISEVDLDRDHARASPVAAWLHGSGP